jgi:hypothetical protein
MANRRALLIGAALIAAIGLTTVAQAAPNCGLVGRWHMNGNLDFPSGASVVDCSITIQSNGNYTGNCHSWSTGQAVIVGSVNGTIKANARCNLSGVLKAPGFADTTIGGGKVRGVTANVVGYRGDANSPVQVRFLNLIRE